MRINEIKDSIDILSDSIMNGFQLGLISADAALERINKIRIIQGTLLSL